MLPLRDASLLDPTRGGFGYLQDNGAGCFHPGVDLNAGDGAQGDCGADVVAFWDMSLVVTVDEATGFGLHQWWRLLGGDYDGHYVHFCHLMQVAHRADGMLVARGDVIGKCGRSGGWEHCHLHLEVRKDAPPHWSYWPKGERKAAVASAYVDPVEVCARYDRLAGERAERVKPDLGPLLDTIGSTGYPVGEACRLIQVAHVLGANADSVDGWVNEIGALRAEVARLTALVGPVEALAAPAAGDEAADGVGDASGA